MLMNINRYRLFCDKCFIKFDMTKKKCIIKIILLCYKNQRVKISHAGFVCI